jgi:hypothetical protein
MRKTRKMIKAVLFGLLALTVTGCSDNTISCFDPEVRTFTEKELKKVFAQGGENLGIAIKNIDTVSIERHANKRTCSCELVITNNNNGRVHRQKVAYTTQWDSATETLKIELEQLQ